MRFSFISLYEDNDIKEKYFIVKNRGRELILTAPIVK